MAGVALAVCAGMMLGCNGPIPRIDPTGQSLFYYPTGNYVPQPGAIRPRHDTSITVTPARVIAPIGSEVIMQAAVCGQDGYLVANERVEWMIAPQSVGHIVAVGGRTKLDWFAGYHTWPRKLDNTFALGTTSSRYLLLTRGTPTPQDDVPILKGQAWITVTSPVEGISHVTAFAPEVYGWDNRLQTADIHWIDAQWALPPPAINPAGTRHVFTTTVNRASNMSPLVGWRVRYEITGGPAGAFAPDGGQVAEVATNALGQASVEIFQPEPKPGTNTIAIQIIRPGELAPGDGGTIVVGNGQTQKTWSSPGLALSKTGPAQGSVGATLSYRIEVQNPGDLPADDVVVTDQLSEGLSYLSSNPAGTVAAGHVEWRLGQLGPHETRTIEVDFRADRPGTVNNCAAVRAADGLAAQDCAATTIMVAALEATMTGPTTAVVGQEVTFVTTVTNRGGVVASGLVLVDRFDAGLQHAAFDKSPIERDLDSLEPGQSRQLSITFQVTQPGTLCNTVEVVGQWGTKATAQSCLTASPAPIATPPRGETPTQPPPTTTGQQPVLAVRKTGPPRQFMGEIAEFVIEITNTGEAQATNLKIADGYDLMLDPVKATDGYAFAGDDLIWRVDKLPPGKTIRFRIHCRCVATAENACNRVTVTCQEGSRADSQACLKIEQPPMALGMTITDNRDPVAAGNEVTYEIRVTNQAGVSDRGLVVVVEIPDEMTPVAVGTSGPVRYAIQGKTVRFEPVAEVRAGETLTYRVHVKADRAGQVAVRAEATSAGVTTPVVQRELTKLLDQ